MTNEEMTPDAALAALPERLRNPRGPVLPSEEEAKEFHNKVDEVTRLIECLKEGTIPPEYVDRKIQEEEQKKEEEKRKEQERKKKEEEDKKLTPEREAALRERAAELEASYKRKQRARARFEEYVQTAEAKKSSTDYERWDMWCPSDDEDELINKLTLPNTAEFKAMEKDIDERHRRQVEGRQIAERCRVKGNDMYKAGQWAAAYDWYTQGLEHEKSNVALHANAAMASIRMGCNVQAIEHADKAIRICDFLLEKPKHPLKVKALQRASVARLALHHYKEAISALEEAAKIEPENEEVAKQLRKAKMEQEEEQKEGMVGKAARGGVGADMDTLRKVEELSKALCLSPSSGAGDHHQPAGLGLGLPPSRKSKIPACKAVAEAAQELADLLNEHDSCRVYLRQCGGLEALLKLVGSSEAGPETLVAAIGALQAACTNERTAAAAVSKGLYPALVLLLASSKESFGVKSAAALLLGNCAVDHDERKAVSAALAGALPQVLPLLGDQGAPPPSFQASLLVLLQNCAVEKTAQDAFVAAQAGRGLETGTPLGDVAALLSSTRSLLAERAASLLGNLLMDQRLREGGGRAGAVACRLLDHVVLQDRRAVAAPGDDVLLPSLAALNNCLLEADACRAVLEGGGERLTALAPHVGHSNPAVAGRAAGAVARLVRHKEGRDAFLGDTAALRGFVNALSGACGKLRGGNVRGGALAEVAGGCCRALAVALSTGGPGAACTAAEAGAIPALLEAIGTPEVPDAAAGNAALAISDIARGKEHLPALRDADAVARLVGCAHKRQDKNAKRNAAIALARIAQDAACLQRLKDLHGLEIIYQTARP